MIDFTNREMTNAFRAHVRSAQTLAATNSQYLLLFYAVECGLKALYMNQRHKKLTSECVEFKEIKHDIRELAQRLSLSPTLYSKLAAIEINPINVNGTSQKRIVHPKNLNEAWRYCGTGPEQPELINALHGLITKIKELLG